MNVLRMRSPYDMSHTTALQTHIRKKNRSSCLPSKMTHEFWMRMCVLAPRNCLKKKFFEKILVCPNYSFEISLHDVSRTRQRIHNSCVGVIFDGQQDGQIFFNISKISNNLGIRSESSHRSISIFKTLSFKSLKNLIRVNSLS